ncbi:MAG: SsrA-binding protein SmpB [Ruminococcaceae bacterium]|nr:SsrA-binding protein SmpB [Oscillospiraceae bacterium]
MANNQGIKIIAKNRKAYHDYFVEETYEAGVELCGTEVKSVRLGEINLKDSFCEVSKGEVYALNIHISPYEKGNIFNRDPLRKRRLLLHKREILKLGGHVAREGYSIIPLSVYLKGSLIKMEIGMCKGKKLYDKRDTEIKKQRQRDAERGE